ncbi:MAG: molybdopterin-dependent oxidoreductase [Chloroflexi bacterium]|nr:molybdopterin-dependent oxidoreductase [Chloroflexota bacterium]
MKYPWANTFLLLLLTVESLAGVLGLVSGSPDKAAFILIHRVAGWGILAVLSWKVVNVRRSLRLRRAGSTRVASLALLVVLVLTLTSGFVWSITGPYQVWRLSGVSWHIYIGVALTPLLIWHAARLTAGLPPSFWADRRTFIRFAGVVGVALLLWRVSEAALAAGDLPGARRRFTGSYAVPDGRGNSFPQTSWLNDNPAPVSTDSWRVKVHGAVEREFSKGYDDLIEGAAMSATLDCTGGWNTTRVWHGIRVADLLDEAGPVAEAASVTFTSVTGYYRRFSMKEAGSYLLATHVGDELLSHGHGYPLRLVAPGKRGFEWVKWVTDIRVNRTSKWWQPPLPLQ